jgi:hypothetical protein
MGKGRAVCSRPLQEFEEGEHCYAIRIIDGGVDCLREMTADEVEK